VWSVLRGHIRLIRGAGGAGKLGGLLAGRAAEEDATTEVRMRERLLQEMEMTVDTLRDDERRS
jgi:hypothetical protein